MFKEKLSDKKSIKTDGSKFQSKNLIPRDVRKMFKAKNKASKALKMVTSVNRCLNPRKRICALDNQIRKSYEERRLLKEQKIFMKAKENKNVLFKYIKKCQNTRTKIGPFIKNGKIIPGKECDILQDQYTSVFSYPLEDKGVTDPIKIFEPKCDFCQNEIVHICHYDYPSENYPLSSEPTSGYIYIDKNLVRNTMSKFSTSLAAGLDGIPSILINKCADLSLVHCPLY